jgi:hypothetical protein
MLFIENSKQDSPLTFTQMRFEEVKLDDIEFRKEIREE